MHRDFYLNTLLKADLHCHSFFSDGALSPEQLVERALQAEIDLLALTDHDTIAGVLALREAALNKPIQIISGVELSVRWKMHDVHVLGLNIDESAPSLTAMLAKQNIARTERAQQMAELLKPLGVQEAYQKACELAGHERIGRPHLAQVLINEGVVPNMQAAFKRYLGKGKMAYVHTAWLSLPEAISGIKLAGGEAVLAHPLKYKLTRSKLNVFLLEFKTEGGAGIEVVSGEMNVSQIGEMAGLCQRFDLLASTGSDYHSDNYSRIKLGHQRFLPSNCKPIWNLWAI